MEWAQYIRQDDLLSPPSYIVVNVLSFISFEFQMCSFAIRVDW